VLEGPAGLIVATTPSAGAAAAALAMAVLVAAVAAHDVQAVQHCCCVAVPVDLVRKALSDEAWCHSEQRRLVTARAVQHRTLGLCECLLQLPAPFGG